MKRKVFFLFVITLFIAISWSDNGVDRIKEGTYEYTVLGWSHDGKIAYEEDVYIDAMPGTARGFIVFDLVDDKIVFETSYAKPYGDDSYNEQTEAEWFEQSKTKAKDYGIIFSQDFEAGDVPFYDEKSDAVFCPLIVKDGKIMQDKLVETSPMGGEGLSGSKIVMLKIAGYGASAGIHGKVIVETFNASITEKVGFINIYKSPFEDRLAVLVETYSWGFEGSEERGIFFIGCHMKYGFTSDAAYKSLYDKWQSMDYSK